MGVTMSISRISFEYDNLQGTIATVHSGENLEKQSNFRESADCHLFVRLFLFLIWGLGSLVVLDSYVEVCIITHGHFQNQLQI